MMNRILVIQTASIGDVILMTPIIEVLHAQYPEAEIDVMVRYGSHGVFDHHPYLHHIFVWDKRTHKYSHLKALLGEVRRRKYNLIVNLQRYSSTAMFTLLSNAEMTVGFKKSWLSMFYTHKVKHWMGSEKLEYIHEVDRNLSLLSFLNIDTSPWRRPRLYPHKQNFDNVSNYKRSPYICIAPASLWETKQYPQEHWVEFVNNIPENYNVYLLGVKSDKAISDYIIEHSTRERVYDLLGKCSILDSAALINDAAMTYVNDSAVQHMASAMNSPITVLFCSTVPALGYGPLSEKSYVIESLMSLSCRPCGSHGHRRCPLGHFDCANTINLSQLLETIP